jgi:paraquat-inducible protein A
MQPSPLVICPHCDSVYQRTELQVHGVACCLRCAAPLLIANCYPIVQLDVRAERSATTLWGAIIATFESGYSSLAAMALVCAFLFPLLQILVSLYVVLPLRAGIRPPGFAAAMHALRYMWPWSAVEVFMLGALVAVVKLGNVAAVVIGPGLFGFGALTILLTLVGSFDVDELWLAGDRAEPA